MARAPRLVALLALAVSLVVGGCSSGAQPEGSSDAPTVVAAEDFWGSIASQLGGDRVSVTSIITDPNADPHDYEPTTEDAGEIATDKVVI
jgi:zinc/manganese transport system substrate-binding protein